ncbi:MAG: pectin esterase [Spirochaetes bacterium]|nr:pectin esterase [Spirochaetota bacterium]
MKKKGLILLCVLMLILSLIWFNCNPFQEKVNSSQELNILDDTDMIRATGATDPFARNPVGFASLNGGTTGGAGGPTVTVTNKDELKDYALSSWTSDPYIIKVSGTIYMDKGEMIWVSSNKTIVGIGSNATISGGEFRMESKSNIIIRNLTIRDSFVEGDWDGKTQDYDGIQTDYCNNIWIDHCHFTHLGDGLIDIRNITTYVTVSWCVFSNHNKCFGLGWNDDRNYKVTIHHCWFNGTYQRNPSFDNGIGHLYNNYLCNIGGYGNYSRGYARMVIENSYFENCTNPYYADSTAELVNNGSIVVNCSGIINTRGSAFNPSSYYSYSMDSASNIRDILRSNAGPNSNIVY